MTTESQAALIEIDKAAAAYSNARDELDVVMANLNEVLDGAKRKHVPAMRRAVKLVAERHEALKTLLQEHPDLFDKPRTHVLHGIRVGFRASGTTIVKADQEVVISMIEAAMPKKAPMLIKTEKTLRKEALKALSDDELKAIACERVPGVDAVVITSTDEEVEKLVGNLIKAAIKEPA